MGSPSVISSLVYCQGSALPAGVLLPVYLSGLWNLCESHLWGLSRSGCWSWARPLSAASACPDSGPSLPPATSLALNLSPAFCPKLHSPPELLLQGNDRPCLWNGSETPSDFYARTPSQSIPVTKYLAEKTEHTIKITPLEFC